MRHLPNVNSLVRAIKAQVSQDTAQTKVAQINQPANLELATPIARALLKFASRLREEAAHSVSMDDVQLFADRMLEQQDV